MKKFLKIVLIIIGAICLIFISLIGISLFVDFEYDDHIENGRYTYVPEDSNDENKYIELDIKDNDMDDLELTYYDSVEKAILNSPLKEEHKDLSAPKDFLNHVDQTLHVWQGKNYDTIFYRVGTDKDGVQGFVMARCKKQVQNGLTQYAFINASPSTTTPDTTYGEDFKKFIHLSLTLSDAQQDLNPDFPEQRFVFGYSREKEIYSLEVEGQKLDGVIEYEVYGTVMYLWYFNDLKSNIRGDLLSYSVDLPKQKDTFK